MSLDFWTTILLIFGLISLIDFSISLKIKHFRLVSVCIFLFYLFSTIILFSAHIPSSNYQLTTKKLELEEPTSSPLPPIDEDQLFAYINQIRSDFNIKPLSKSDQLCLFTQTRIDQLLENQNNLDQVQKPVYPKNLLAELYFAALPDLDTAKSLIQKDSIGDKHILLKDKYNQTVDIACLKVAQSQDGFIVLLQLGSSQTPTPILSNLLPKPTDDQSPWGVAVQIDEHTWTMKVQDDDRMSTVEELFTALNDYRRNKGVSVLNWDQKLTDYAQSRADYFYSIKSTDAHAGFNDYLTNQDGFNQLGFSRLGENASFGYQLFGVHLIEWIYAGDEPHDKNQLNKDWAYVGIGIKGTATCLIFATGKF